MNDTDPCFEIVHFAFVPEVSPGDQLAAMKTLGEWAATQPGFVGRQSYRDPVAARWTDVVEWTSLQAAQAAMARSQQAPALAGIMALIDPETVHAGHFERTH